MPQVVAMAGGASLFGQAGKHSPSLDWDDLRATALDAAPVRMQRALIDEID